MKRVIVHAGLASAALASSLALSATPTQAAAGACDSGKFCYFFNSNQAGSSAQYTSSVGNYGTGANCHKFTGAGAGKGRCIKNDAASVWNRTSKPVTVYFNSNYAGPSQTIKAGAKANLNATLKNNNASHRIGAAPPPPGGSYGTPKDNPHPPELTRAPKATKRTQHVDNEIARLTGEKQCYVGDYRPGQSTNHNTGNALDCTISNGIGQRPSKAQRDQGWKLANWLRKHANRLDVRYVIWDNKIWSVARNNEGWRNYGGSGVTDAHLDHVHVSIQNPKGDGS